MSVWPLRSQFGIVDVRKDGKVLGFQEKPILDKWINIGYFYFNHEMINKINQYDRFDFFLKDLAEQNLLNAFKHTGLHITVNSIKELVDAEKNINKVQGNKQ